MDKKIFFIHVAKTAGSSFNAFLKHYFNGEDHCEKYLNSDRNTFYNLEHLKKFDYISGHLRWSVFWANDLSQSEYFTLAFLREPISHLLSHLNWVIHIYDISPEFFKAHPKIIQDISLDLRRMDLSCPDELISALKKYQGLFRNNQSKYFIDEPEVYGSQAVIDEVLKLDMIGLTEWYEESLNLFIAKNKLYVEPKLYHSNQNLSYRVKSDILKNSMVYDFLQDYNRVDLDVYALIYQSLKSILE